MATKIGTNNQWEQHCPDCNHCFQAHGKDNCEAVKLEMSKSPGGVKRRTKCECPNSNPSLVNWQNERMKELGITPEMIGFYGSARQY